MSLCRLNKTEAEQEVCNDCDPCQVEDDQWQTVGDSIVQSAIVGDKQDSARSIGSSPMRQGGRG